MTLPDRLSAALAPHRPEVDSSDYQPAGRRIIRRGDIRRVESYLGREDVLRLASVLEQQDPRVPAVGADPEDVLRLALVLDCDDDSAEIVLVHPYVELATEADLVFTPDETGVPYSIVVQTRVRSAVWTVQMRGRERVGSLTEEALSEFGRVAVADDPFAVSLRTGTPLAGPADPRWEFKQQEVETLNRLAADRIYAVFEDGLIPRWRSLSPSSQHPAGLSLVDGPVVHPSEWTMDDLEALSETGAFDLDTWTKQFGRDIGRDLCISNQVSIDYVLAA